MRFVFLKRGHIHKARDLCCTVAESLCSLSPGELGIVSDNHSTCLSKTKLSKTLFRESKVTTIVDSGVVKK